ncbi:hypothetical protein EMPG_13190 [Blastomyces silverae]|uniref:Uncharacterized protein n=1 Tax=Blastomyces silverae TaxID=2060906 RepID=A0A0H1BJV2_9EURO|nr:hypothetical protein EMPG_13190 [Blastomyces silverae]
MDSNSQDSPDVENTIQSTCNSPASNRSTESPIVSACSSPQQSHISIPASTWEAPEDADGDQQPATPPTPKPWMWTCHKCYDNYSLGATTRCLYDGHYLCRNFLSKRNRQRKYKRQGWKICGNIFDYTGWENMRAWQKQWRQGQGAEEEWESGCMDDCEYPRFCKHMAPTPPCMTERVRPEKQLGITAPASPPPNDNNYSLSSSREGDADDKVRAGSKRARSETTDVPPEAPPAKRRMFTFARMDSPTRKRSQNKPLLIGSPLRVVHCYQTTFLNPIGHARI